MNRTVLSFCRDQFDEFAEELDSAWAIKRKALRGVLGEVRSVHRKYLALACLSNVVGRGVRRNHYVNGISEVAYLSMVMAIKGLENPACVLLRQTIEMAMKHVYFATHPIEFEWVSRRDSYREIGFQFLLEYLRKTDQHSNFPDMPGIFDRLAEQFGILSRYVHVQNKAFIKYSKICRHGLVDVGTLRSVDRKMQEVVPFVVVLLLAFFPRKYRLASVTEQKLVQLALPSSYRECVKKYLRQISI